MVSWHGQDGLHLGVGEGLRLLGVLLPQLAMVAARVHARPHSPWCVLLWAVRGSTQHTTDAPGLCRYAVAASSSGTHCMSLLEAKLGTQEEQTAGKR